LAVAFWKHIVAVTANIWFFSLLEIGRHSSAGRAADL
jgi:hypothetical protein